MAALDAAVRQGKALYAGVSNYPPELTARAIAILERRGTPLLIHRPRYSLLDRATEEDLLDVLERHKVGSIVFSPLAQGMLTDRYLDGLPNDSRARIGEALDPDSINDATLVRVRALNRIAQRRGQSRAQLAIAWVLRDHRVSSALLGVSSVGQLEQNVAAIANLDFDAHELREIESACGP